MTKIIAFYLPQFHSIPENDKWWGKGFTDWVNVKKAVASRKGQYQPRIPLNNNYYDLSNPDTIRWQANLARKYNIYGFCIYHYWFNGKLLLQKPAELLLEHKDIAINYCFSWANEPWARTWDGKNHQVLMSQEYGNEKNWIEHFNYLLPFFQDKRYIKENGKPMFLIYKSSSIKDCAQMMECWNKLAQQNGFAGIHFVETLKKWYPEKRDLPFDARVEFEPTGAKNISHLYKDRVRRRAISFFNKIFKTKIPHNKTITFEEESSYALKNLSEEGTYPGAFIGWDNTPRRGLHSIYIETPSKNAFKEYLRKKIEIGRRVYKTEYLFINAWNEWAEGTYLEPDELHKYEFLEAIQEVLEETSNKEKES